MSDYIEHPKGVCCSDPDALIAALRDVGTLVGLPDYAVTFCVSPWPDGGWMAGFRLDDEDWAVEQGLESRFLPLDPSYGVWDVFNGFKVGVTAHGAHMAEAIENAIAKVRALPHREFAPLDCVKCDGKDGWHAPGCEILITNGS